MNKYKIVIVINDIIDDEMTNYGKGYTKEEATNIALDLPPCFDYVGIEEYDIKGGIYFE